MVSIIIVNYNVAEEIRNSIRSIYSFVKCKFEIIVVDNNSPDRKIELLEKEFPEVKFFFMEKNLGFGCANNFAVNNCNGDYILFLNPDTLLIEDFISPTISFIQSNNNAGACGPVLLNSDRSIQNSTGIKMGILYEASEAFMFIGLFRKIYRIWFNKKIAHKNPFEVKWLSAACIVISRKVFDLIGGFSPDFFLNYEDIDLCERVRNLGYKNYCLPEYRCVHLDQRSQTKDLSKFVISRYQGRIIYSQHHYSIIKKLIINSFHILGLLMRIATSTYFYSGDEKKMRTRGYIQSIKLYFK